jgi:predicted nucleic acid-binding OB-fold protein
MITATAITPLSEERLKKPYITTKDIEEEYQCSKTIAQKIMREIKAYGVKIDIKGKVLVSDYIAWYMGQNARQTANNFNK